MSETRRAQSRHKRDEFWVRKTRETRGERAGGQPSTSRDETWAKFVLCTPQLARLGSSRSPAISVGELGGDSTEDLGSARGHHKVDLCSMVDPSVDLTKKGEDSIVNSSPRTVSSGNGGNLGDSNPKEMNSLEGASSGNGGNLGDSNPEEMNSSPLGNGRDPNGGPDPTRMSPMRMAMATMRK
jgi:hypothetical protein